MNATEISKLLGKYYDGETSLQEEVTLCEYFAADDVPEEFAAEKEIFRHYSRSAVIPEPSDDLEKRIISALDSEEAKGRHFRLSRRELISYSSVAGLLLLVGSYFLLSRSNQPGDTFSNPELAYAETVKILYEVSSQMNHGTAQLNRVGKIEDFAVKSFSAMSRSSATIDRNLKNLDYFQQAFRIVSSPVDYVLNK